MHGRERGENRRRIRHMWPVASRGSTTTVGVDSGSSSANSFLKDGRKITFGDCALFKPPNDSPPFIGIIHSISADKEISLKLGVSWLYRPSEVVLCKGVVLEAAPNEVFYSFHRDETPAVSLLHPCKVSFFPKGVELPPGVSSFVCRRVYDIRNKRLWWLTDKNYINDWQEEIDQLLQKSRLEMHATVKQHQGTPSPKPVNGATATSPLKHSPDSMQSSGNLASHPKGKKRELGDQTSEPVKRIKDGGDSIPSRSESFLKSEITKITEKGGLVDYESVEKLVQLMQPGKSQKKIDLSSRSMLAGIIASTDKFDCLNQFVQLRGLPVLDDWLREVHKGKVGDSNSSKDGDKSVEDFLLVLLRALDKIPVNLNALQTCNIGKSVNNLRSCKNMEIQKKARSLVDTWKKRVEAEMNVNDAKPVSNQPVAWSSRSRHDVPHGGNKHTGGSSDTAIRNSGQFSSAKAGTLKPANGDTTTRAASVPSGSPKISPSLPLMNSNHKEGQIKVSSTGGGSEVPHYSVKDEKSTSSSQSHTNSQCSSDHARSIVPSGKEDARSSTAGSKSSHEDARSSTAGSKSTHKSRHRKSANGLQAVANSSAHKESGSSRNSSLPSGSHAEKFCESATVTCENNGVAPVAENNRHKIIVKIPNRGHSPGQIANFVSNDDPSCRSSRATSPVPSEKHDEADASLREKITAYETKEVDMTSVPPGKQHTPGSDAAILPDVSKTGYQSTEKEEKSKRSVGSSMTSMNALIDSCAKYSETHASIPVGDDSGMNLLASVATGEISRSSAATPEVSPQRNTTMAENAGVDIEGVTKCNIGETSGHSSMFNEELPRDGDSFLKSNRNLDGLASNASVSVSFASLAGKNDEGATKQILAKGTIVKDGNDDSASGVKHISKSLLPSQDDVKDEKESEVGMNETRGDSLMRLSSSYTDEKNNPEQGLNSNSPLVHEPTCLPIYPVSANKEDGQVGVSSVADEELVLDVPAKSIAEDTVVMEDCKNGPDCGNKMTKQESNASLSPHREEGSALASVGFEGKTECKTDNLEHEEREVGSHFSSKESDGMEVHGARKVDCASSATNASTLGAGISETGRKLEFDLNEGFDMDDVKNEEQVNFAATAFPPYITASQSAVSSASFGLPTSVTVASAAKGPFVPPEDLLRNKAELGWKGSAATSAFRPAEPRRLLDSLTGSTKVSLESIAPKPVRPFLDFDLNVSDERVLQDLGCQSSIKEVDLKSDHKNGGLELDLNEVNDVPELGYHSARNFRRLEVSLPLQSSNDIIESDNSNKRNFDLNDGPAVEESTYRQHVHGNIPPPVTFGMRMNYPSSLYSSGTTYSAVTTPAALPDVPIIGPPGPHRVLGGPAAASSFNADFYRASMLATSPAVSFTPAPFQYPVFPLGATYPVPTTTLSGGSASYLDPSSGGRFYTPSYPTQLVGTSTAVSSQYLRPCAVSVPDVSSNGVGESSQKWVRQGLDLNSGPLALDVEGRDDTFLLASRQLPAVNSRTLLDEQTRAYQTSLGVLKRKEPEGGWNTDRMSYKQSSLQ